MTNGKNTQSGPMMRGLGAGIMALAIALAAGAATTPARADTGYEGAHLLRSLDIMLMVTSLRCRTGAHDFRADYERFATAHLPSLNAAGQTLRVSLAARLGEPDPARALDRMGVRIANSYGDGHPWMDCAELQRVTRELSHFSDSGQLAEAARVILAQSRPPFALQFAGQVRELRSQTIPSQDHAVQIGYNMAAEWEPGRP